ncbi:isoleucine--tRNA ligase [Candidatus Woesearchaeota archaeon]|nr:isoleucine--tRNA ligase [Candidatus Woesearchaeota archaeon]
MTNSYVADKLEKEILQFWQKKQVYKKAKTKNNTKKRFYYLDGPPYTSGRIHLGTAWGKALRDALMRYKRMKGYNVWDRAGFDMHGLPISHKVEEKLKLESKEEIEKYGVEKFVKECKKLALQNMHLMIEDFTRMGVWMDFENPYKSIDNSYIEGIWWLVKKAHENKRLYEGLRTLTWCASCETSTAKHELEYKNVTDNSIFVKFPLENQKGESLIIWTTTPWTIAFNLAVMVNPELDYVRAKVDNEIWIVAKALAAPLIIGVANKKYKIIEEFKGKKLEGIKYAHPFEDIIDFPKAKKLHTVLMSTEYVNTTAGSGLVHCAPGCGPEDYEVGVRNKLPIFNLVNEQGKFNGIKAFEGLQARVNDKKFTEELDKRDALIATTPVEHDYAHCERCKEPIIFRATKQWFFKIEDLKERMKTLNKKTYWVPDWAGSRQFHSWLDNLRDNSITKQIYWGTPLPVWKCEKCDDYTVIGSTKELAKLGVKVPTDLHKPYIDRVTLKCKCGGTKKRCPDVLDVWVDAGCSSWLCLDYPVRTDLFDEMFPADFILEGKDQIRGWFNLLFVASMVSMNKHSFDAVYMHGFINDAMGRKMSKSLGNIISPFEVFDKYGADTFRYYTIGAANPGLDLNYNFEDMKVKNKTLFILWNLQNFLFDLTRQLKINPTKLTSKDLDICLAEQYMLSKLNSSIKKTTELFDVYKLSETPQVVEQLFLELSRTYIQLTRDKASLGNDKERKTVAYVAYQTIYNTLLLFAPIAPFITEQIYQNFKTEYSLKDESIHLIDWPKSDTKKIDTALEKNFEIAKEVISSTLAARERASLGIRWPVQKIIIATTNNSVKTAVKKLFGAIKQQTNVKEIEFVESFKAASFDVKPNYKNLGQVFGKDTAKVGELIKKADSKKLVAGLKSKGVFKVGKYDIKNSHVSIEETVAKPYYLGDFKFGSLYIDSTRTQELESEGYARELMRRIQVARKNLGLQKIDDIRLTLVSTEGFNKMLEQYSELIREKVGAKELVITTKEPTHNVDYHKTEKIKTEQVKLFVEKQ